MIFLALVTMVECQASNNVQNLVAFAPFSSTEGGEVTEKKIFMPEIITHNSIVLNKVKYIKIEQTLPLPVVDGFPLKP